MWGGQSWRRTELETDRSKMLGGGDSGHYRTAQEKERKERREGGENGVQVLEVPSVTGTSAFQDFGGEE